MGTTDGSGQPDGSAGYDDQVGVVLVTHNRPELMRKTLASILSQEYSGDIQVVIVFDRSEPDTTVVQDDPHRSVRVMANTRAPGLAGGRNTGILELSTELVAFCDDDDTWAPTKLQPTGRAAARTAGRGVRHHRHAGDLGRHLDHPGGGPVRGHHHRPGAIADGDAPLVVVPLPQVRDGRRVRARGRDVAAQHGRGLGPADPRRPTPADPARRRAADRRAVGSNVVLQRRMARQERCAPDAARPTRGDPRRQDRRRSASTESSTFGHAAVGERRQALHYARQGLRTNWKEPRTVLGLLVVAGVPPAWIQRKLNERGRGI